MNRKRHFRILMITFLMLFSGCAAAEGLWEADRYIALPTRSVGAQGGDSTTDLYDLYDSEGNLAGTTVYSSQVGQYFAYMEKGRLYSYWFDNETVIQNTTTLDVLYSYGQDECASWVGKEHFGILDFSEGTLELYDADGNLQNRSTPGALGDLTSDAVLQGVEADGTVLLSVIQDYQSVFAQLFGGDGFSVNTEEESFPEALRKGCSGSIGEFFLVSGDEGLYSVYTRDGLLLMKDVRCSNNMGDYQFLKIGNYADSQSTVDYVLLGNGDSWRVFDRKLQETGTSASASLSVSDGYAIGMACDALEGRICTDIIPYCSYKKVPCCIDGDQCTLNVDGEILTFSLPRGEALYSLNETWVQTSLQDEGGKAGEYRLYRIEDLSAGKQEPSMAGKDRALTLVSGSVLEGGGYWGNGGASIIYNDSLEVLFTTEAFLQPALGGKYFLRRGPWLGIIDREGNWLIRGNAQSE